MCPNNVYEEIKNGLHFHIFKEDKSFLRYLQQIEFSKFKEVYDKWKAISKEENLINYIFNNEIPPSLKIIQNEFGIRFSHRIKTIFEYFDGFIISQ